jgi:hypothetical protein
MLYSPVAYEYAPLTLATGRPEADWFQEAFLSFVRGEFGGRGSGPAPEPLLPTIVGEESVGSSLLEKYLEVCELLIYEDPVRAIQHASSGDMAEDVFRVLTNPHLGHKQNKGHLDWDDFGDRIRTQVERKERLLFVVPACPFKDQNPLRTLSGAAFPDMGDVAFLVTLHTLALALYQVHPFGADWLIVADGELYAGLFGVAVADAIAYRERLRRFRNRLNMQGTVHILDLAAVIESCRKAERGEIVDELLEHFRVELRRCVDLDSELGEAFAILTHGMRRNLATRHLAKDHAPSTIWEVLNADSANQVDAALRATWEELQERAVTAGVEYGAVNLMLRRLDLVNNVFPGSFRGTVHPKGGQVAVRSHGSGYPWNAVAFRRSETITPRMFESHPLYELAREGDLKCVYLQDYSESAPLYLQRV